MASSLFFTNEVGMYNHNWSIMRSPLGNHGNSNNCVDVVGAHLYGSSLVDALCQYIPW